ncbi:MULTISPECIES: hypothetical protein [unclassified Actinopolyspora]|uniref:hypothetical protein n=1 Tax=unclassified Actinopolyspora TaxID=2639451 RepID=UPI001A998B02|nr:MULTISPECIES: hypothetical protein [unclassified Actinopolyspora]
MGIPAWVWFVVAAVAIAAGVALLITDRARRTAKNRERRRWAALRGWQFAEYDQVLPTKWQRGLLPQYSGAVATDIVAGSTFTADGRRQVSVLDLVVGGRTVAVLVGLRCRRPIATTLELWLPEVPVPHESELDLLGPVGSRYAFVGDVATARPNVTPDVVDAVEEFGDDVTVVWAESDWVLAALEPGATDPAQLESVLRALGQLADLVDPFEVDPNEDRPSEHSAPDEAVEEAVEESADDAVAEVDTEVGRSRSVEDGTA